MCLMSMRCTRPLMLRKSHPLRGKKIKTKPPTAVDNGSSFARDFISYGTGGHERENLVVNSQMDGETLNATLIIRSLRVRVNSRKLA
ncbi:hypothetical protein Pan258_33710 [Symmachiella dynata]|nr:hypothetical protein Pan258_33710 [Symmachiella dynata]